MPRTPDTITMLPSEGLLDLDRAVPAALVLLGPRLQALREQRPVFEVVKVAERRAEVENPAA